MSRKKISKGESVHAIAVRLRFCSSSYFAQAFQQVTGLTPGQWREREGRSAPPAEETTKHTPR
ncbi:MAG: AraC family transcriptional regulator [Oscillospiraceae bacterium]|nr:AraC family transcriptional regulator [Oscillospiraceae bacterium]